MKFAQIRAGTGGHQNLRNPNGELEPTARLRSGMQHPTSFLSSCRNTPPGPKSHGRAATPVDKPLTKHTAEPLRGNSSPISSPRGGYLKPFSIHATWRHRAGHQRAKKSMKSFRGYRIYPHTKKSNPGNSEQGKKKNPYPFIQHAYEVKSWCPKSLNSALRRCQEE